MSDKDSLEYRALDWIANGFVGSSSKAIWAHMVGVETVWTHPRDPDDFNRCHLLLLKVPEWRLRMPEMADRGPEWAALVKHWDTITDRLIYESENRGAPPRCYDLMQSVLAPVYKQKGGAMFCFGPLSGGRNAGNPS